MQMTFEEFKKKNEKYYKSMFEKNKKLFNTDTLFLNGEILTIEKAMEKGFRDESIYEQLLTKQAS